MKVEADFEATVDAVKYFKTIQSLLGNITEANMQGEKCILTFRDDRHNVLKFLGGFSAGYEGEGPGGTAEVLKLAGFPQDYRYVANNTDFILRK